MKAPVWVSALFWIAAVYDGVLGVVFLTAPLYVFERFGVTPPNHVGYVQFPAALLIVFAVMFVAIAIKPAANRQLIVYGILFKIAYVGVAAGHWLAAGIPAMWKPLAIVDLALAVLFAAAYFQLRSTKAATGEVPA